MSASDITLKKWQDLSTELRNYYPTLYSFYCEARCYPKITELYPFLSVSRLCLSRCTQYPYFVDFIIASTTEGDIILRKTDGRGGWVESTEVGKHRPEHGAEVLNKLIPDSYGEAIEGTADEIRKS